METIVVQAFGDTELIAKYLNGMIGNVVPGYEDYVAEAVLSVSVMGSYPFDVCSALAVVRVRPSYPIGKYTILNVKVSGEQ